MRLIHTFSFLLLFWLSPVFAQKLINTKINKIIGDESYIQRFHKPPTPEVDRNLRVKLHLEHVERVLRKSGTQHLQQNKTKNREKMLDLLHDYWSKGVFPINDNAIDGVPCFMDKDGRLCAVGYLVAQTAGRQVASDLNTKYKYDYFLDIEDPILDAWIENSGLTKLECATIQPSNYVRPEPMKVPSSSSYLWTPTPSELEKKQKKQIQKQKDSILRLNAHIDSLRSLMLNNSKYLDSLNIELNKINDYRMKDQERTITAAKHAEIYRYLSLGVFVILSSIIAFLVIKLRKTQNQSR